MSEVFETSKDVKWLKDLYFSDPSKRITLKPGEQLLKEGTYNDRLFLILNGSLTGYLEDDNGENFEVYRTTANMFVGVYSFFSPDHITYLTLIAEQETTVAFIGQEKKQQSEEKFASHFLPVIVHELYLRQLLAQKLTIQRQAAVKKLYEKEKMAVLGQLAAGLAHELNNSVGVLQRNTEWLIQSFTDYLKDHHLNSVFESSLNEGLSFDTVTLREKRKSLEKKFGIPGKLAKQLAKTALTEEQIGKLLKANPKALETINLITEAGFVLHDMKLAAAHSTHVVLSVRELGSSNRGSKQDTSIYQTLTQSLALLKSLLQNIQVDIRKSTDGVLAATPGDLVQVWLNLIKNACESMTNSGTENPRLIIDIKKEGSYFSVSIGDNGPGISEEAMAKVFEPNFTTKVKGLSFGLGLGLSIVKKIVNSYKGKITVTSKPGETYFTVLLPDAQQ
jgi:signal transduction histidine kinase